MSRDDPQLTPLPILETELDEGAIRDRLMKLAKRGELPGYSGETERGVFVVDAQGTPFDYDLIAELAASDGGPNTLRFRLRVRRLLPIVFGAVLVGTVWPGLPVTDSLLVTYFRSYESLTGGWFKTWMWYLPLTVIPLPWAWRALWKRARLSSREHAELQVSRVKTALGATERS